MLEIVKILKTSPKNASCPAKWSGNSFAWQFISLAIHYIDNLFRDGIVNQQGVRVAEPPGFTGGVGGAAPQFAEGLGGAAPQFAGVRGAQPPVLQGVRGAQQSGMAGGFGGPPGFPIGN